MPQLRVALAQVDSTVGDLPGNVDTVLRWSAHAAERGAHLVAFPEMMIPGYPPEDLVLRRSFLEASASAVDSLARQLAAAELGGLVVVVGYLGGGDPAPAPLGRPAGEPHNAAAVLHGGRVVARYAKHHLPNYGVFDERRYFVPGTAMPVVRVHGVDVGLVICEDLWQDGGPVAVAARANVGLLVCLNGSPYERGKSNVRLELSARRAREAGATLAYVNLIGGQDELVFEGDSLVVDTQGQLLARAPQFEQGLLTADLDLPQAFDNRTGNVDAGDGSVMTVARATISADPLPPYPPERAGVARRLTDPAEVYAALIAGTRSYVHKNGFSSVVLGLSGGIDSALVATIARDALGAEAVHAVAMPSRYSSEHSLADAEELARRQGLRWHVIPIDPMVRAYEDRIALDGLASENLQARVRGTTLMALSNQHGHLVLTTGNKSELATGYSTLYGDSAGGFAPIKDVPKTLVWELARWRNSCSPDNPPIPENSISKPPSAELAPGQLDSDRLPDYATLDPVIDDYVERDQGREALIAAGHDAEVVERVIRLIDGAEYKRRQYPPGPKISLRAFGRDRRLPITSRWREIAAPSVPEPEMLRPDQAG